MDRGRGGGVGMEAEWSVEALEAYRVKNVRTTSTSLGTTFRRLAPFRAAMAG